MRKYVRKDSNYVISQGSEISFAQNNEDIILEAIFNGQKKGFYVDVGANHPKYHSVTKNFYDKGWRGINVEPNPTLFKAITEERPKDINLNIGVSDSEEKLSLRVYHSQDKLDGLSTFSKEVKQHNMAHEDADNKNYEDIEIPVQKLTTIFKKHLPKNIQTISFMKVDVEGFEYNVLSGNDWRLYRPQVLCIEANHIIKDWRPIIKKANYEMIFHDGLNEYYIAKEAKTEIKLEGLIERIIILSTHSLKLHHHEAKVHDQKHIDELRKFSEKQNEQINNLLSQVSDLNYKVTLSLRDRSLPSRIKRAVYGLTIDWVRYKKDQNKKD